MIVTVVTCVLGGFYTVQVNRRLRLVLLNTNLYYYVDLKMANQTDPAGQFQWMESILKDANQHNGLVSYSQLTLSLDCYCLVAVTLVMS